MTLIEQFNELTANEFDYLRLNSFDVDIPQKRIVVNLIYPFYKEKEVLTAEGRITDCIKKIINSPSEVALRFVKNAFYEDSFMNHFFQYLKDYPMIGGMLREKDIIFARADKTIIITFILDRMLIDQFGEAGFQKIIYSFLNTNYCEKFDVRVIEKEQSELDNCIEAYVAGQVDDAVINEEHYIEYTEAEHIIGRVFDGPALCLRDARRPRDEIVLCGTIEDFKELARKDKDGQETDKKFYKFTLNDNTDTVSCIYFPTKAAVEKVQELSSGIRVAVKGNLNIDKFRPGSLMFAVRDLALAKVPTDFEYPKISRPVPNDYRYVFPAPYISMQQASVFDTAQKTPKFLRDKCFCVFDLETTGINPAGEAITEIGALRVENGVITEQFSTFVNPGKPIPQSITELTGIRDEDVAGAPTIEQVLPDFYKFSANCAFVGHNVQFDYSFISVSGAKHNIYFDNDLIDTIALAKKFLPRLKNYKLEQLAAYFDLKNKRAHRAVYDAEITAEAFIRICRLMP